MHSKKQNSELGIKNFTINGMMMRYSVFIPRLYNFCKSQGFSPGKILPSRAFCADESQGFPIILITKHFGSFPFNHGRVGGIVATDRYELMEKLAAQSDDNPDQINLEDAINDMVAVNEVLISLP